MDSIGQYKLVASHEEAQSVIREITDSGAVHALDFETAGLRPQDAKVRLTCISGPAGNYVIDHLFCKPFNYYAVALADACPWAVFNAGFEGRWFDYATAGPDVVLFDVGVMSKAKLGGRPLSLADMVKRDLKKERDNKHLQLSDWTQKELSLEQYDYGFEDAEDTYNLYKMWSAALTAEQMAGFYVLNDAWRGTAEMEDTGMSIDEAHHSGLINMWSLRRDVAEKVLRKYTPPDLIANLRSKKQISDFLKTVLDEISLRAWPKTDKSEQLQTDRKQLRQASFRSPYPFSRWAAALMVFNRADKYLGTYGETLLTKQRLAGRVYGRFNIAQAITGRYSSNSPNLQNIPRTPLVRRSFIAPPDTEMVLADYSGIELRVLAEVSNDKQLKQDVIFGDVHAESAITLFKVDPAEFKALLKAKDPRAKEMRSKAKAFSFQLCLAEGQRVLTDVGLVPIEQVDCSMKVWDGVEWVTHDGVIDKGVAEVLEHDGLTATPNHDVFCVDGIIRPIRLAVLAGENGRISRTGTGEIPLRDVRVYRKHGAENSQGRPELLGMRGLWYTATEMAAQYVSWARNAVLLPTQPHTSVRGCSSASATLALLRGEGAMQKERSELTPLRTARDRNAFCVESGVHTGNSFLVSEPDAGAVSRFASGQDRQQRPLRGWEPPPSYCAGEPVKQARVYDILNAGPRRRFTIEGRLVSNCYGAGNAALAMVLRCSDGEAAEYVEKWAERYPNAYALRFQMFDQMNATGLLPIKSGRTVYVHKNERSLPVASNYPIQGAAADVMYRAVTRMSTKVYELPFESRMLASIHDELLMLAETGKGEELREIMVEEMRQAWLDIFPHSETANLSESAVGQSWAAKP